MSQTRAEIIAMFLALPLPDKMVAAASVLDEASARFLEMPNRVGNPDVWSSRALLAFADRWAVEDATEKAVLVENLAREIFTAARASIRGAWEDWEDIVWEDSSDRVRNTYRRIARQVLKSNRLDIKDGEHD